MHQDIAFLAVFTFVYSTLARGIEGTPFGGALLFVLVGFVAGPDLLGIIQLEVGRHEFLTISELALALVLFTDAAKADLSVLERNIHIPLRMLCFGLPLAILLGYLFAGWLFPELSVFEKALIATMLAPTDAALGKAVISNKRVPSSVRESLNVESGLNDGICVPVLFLFLALAVDAGAGEHGVELALDLVAREIGLGLLVGVLLTLVMSWLLRFSARQGWIGGHWRPIHSVAMALSCFSVAQAVEGSGFIAAFVGGLLFGWLVKRYKNDLLRAAEGKVWQAIVASADFEDIRARLPVSGAVRRPDGVHLRLLHETQPLSSARPVEPSLEDAYLCLIRLGAKREGSAA